jgi:amino acid transporter
MASTNASVDAPTRARFGTFAGVFTPNVLTILGIILFLRTGWVVGQAGLIGALIIVLIANSITFLTGLSLSAIATSMNVRAGGNYYLISRTLGLEIGGAIGIPFYFSQAISIAFYIIGFTEALQFLPFFQAFDARLIATIVAIIFTVVAWIGADIALKIQFFILGILVAALLSYFLGGWDAFLQPTLTPSFTEGVNFWLVFAVFFPAVTGIAVGTSMSGDLKDPSRSIPLGTMASIVVTTIVYVAAVVWLATHATVDELINNTFIMSEIALVPILILFGIWAATLSSALGSIMAAPRTLEAISHDRVIPGWFMNRLGSATEPRLAVLFSAAIAFGIIWAGDLNFVAPIITMFFLNTYGMTNLVAGIENLVGNPSFRPRFRMHWSLSILGAIGCYVAMFLINVPATLIAIVVSFGIYFALQRRATSRTWGDVRNGIWFSLARRSLLNLERMHYSPRNWRPNILVFTGQPHNREALVQTAAWLGYGRGIVSFFQLLVGDVGELAGRGLQRRARRQIRHYIRDHNMAAFAEADIVPDFFMGALTVAQSHGVGGFEPNTVLMGWSGTAEGRTQQLILLDSLLSLRKSVLLLHSDQKRGFGRRSVIDVWWRGRSRNADLMLLLAHIISRHPDWRDAKIRLLRVIRNQEGREQTEAHLRRLLDRVRVKAEPIVLVAPEGQDIAVIIRDQSSDSDLTLLGINRVDADGAPTYAERLNDIVGAIGTVMMVHSGDDEELLESGA